MQTEYRRTSNGSAALPGYPETERDPLVEFAMRWWWLLAAGVLLGVLGVLMYARLGPASYTSTALIQVAPITGSDPTDKATQARSAAPNFAAEGTTTRMYGLVSDAYTGLPGITPSELASKARNRELLVRQQRGTNFIEVTIIDADPERAQAIADTFATVMVADINERSQAQLDARNKQLQTQIDFTRQQLTAAQLFDRERELEMDLRDQQQRLLGLQASYRQEAARQLELDQITDGQAGSLEVQGARADFEQIMIEQIQDVQANIEVTNTELADVRARIAALPPDTDPLIETAFASAYGNQLADLTAQYVQGQISSLSAGPPLVQYGDSSEPVSAQELRKLGLMGIAAGGALAAGLALLIDLWRKQQSARTRSAVTARLPVSVASLFRIREQHRLAQAAGALAGGPDDAGAESPPRRRRRRK